MASEEQTPPPDRKETIHGTPAAERTAAVRQARGRLVTAIRDAERYRASEFQRLDTEWLSALTAAWSEYDETLSRLGITEKP